MYVVYERIVNWMNPLIATRGQKYYRDLNNLLRDYPEARLDEAKVKFQNGYFYKEIKTED